MVDYKPKYRRKGINLPFGYYVNPVDNNILLPDAKKLDSLEYAFRMRAKYKTALRDCCMWLHQQTGQRMTAAGFLYAYRAWVKRVKKLNGKAFSIRKREAVERRKKLIEENFGQFKVVLDDRDSVLALAEVAAKKEDPKI